MTSEFEGMPLQQVTHSSQALRKTLSNEMLNSDKNNLVGHKTRPGTSTGSFLLVDRSIVRSAVENSTQNLPTTFKYVPVLDSTGDASQHFAEERRKTLSSDTTNSSCNQAPSNNKQYKHKNKHNPKDQVENIKTSHNDKSVEHTKEITRKTWSLSSANTKFETKNITKSVPMEGNREHHLGAFTIENQTNTTNNSAKIRKRSFESNYMQQQQKNLLSTLPPHHPLLSAHYTVTAAEIALGRPTSYAQRQTKMGDGSRSNPMISHTDQQSKSNDEMIMPQKKEIDEKASGTSTDSFTVISPGRMTPVHDGIHHNHQNISTMIGTPSTVSTAPTSDDEAFIDYKLDETTTLPHLLHPIHQGIHSTREDAIHPSETYKMPHDNRSSRGHQNQNQNPWMQPKPSNTPPHHVPHQPWDSTATLLPNQNRQEQKFATFRNDINFLNHRVGTSQTKDFYQQQQVQKSFQISPPPANRRLTYAHYAAAKKNFIPARSDRNQRQHINTSSRQSSTNVQGNGLHQNLSSSSSSSQRSSSEILKTLLRKKACLYEPETSRSVALVTWLVGRLLALEFGFFSRQQLQCGVHACVAAKIESKTITRTKVNRCMQIILNSCFHYIIPRSDGSEEKGDHFRDAFSKTVQDDSIFLKQLPEPWNDLVVDKIVVIDAIQKELEEKPNRQLSITGRSPSASPKSSPKLGGMNPDKIPDKYHLDSDEREEASKRAVLLCFNENVRSAEDVFRCHNDFIRDTANAANLQLTTQEWRQFFGPDYSQGPQIWRASKAEASTALGKLRRGRSLQHDLLGQMSPEEVGKFRNTWCKKRYDHNHELCGFAHIDVNDGWLRRNPITHSYKNEMCKFVCTIQDKIVSPNQFYLNECPKGIACGYAHSMEEINYHPMNYKESLCESVYSSSGGCRFGDVCPNVHLQDTNPPLKKSSESRSPTGNRGKKNIEQSKLYKKAKSSDPSGSPVIYASPAPYSMFERQLVLPGLQNLYRRQSEVIRAHIRSSGNCHCSYSLFGDNWGLKI